MGRPALKLIIDASVILKWVFPDPEVESHVPEALALLDAVTQGEVEVLQPPHWLIEVAAVLARKAPNNADEALDLLEEFALETLDTPAVLRTARQLATDLDHHLFDTLYHALALEVRGSLVTADDRYYKKVAQRKEVLSVSRWARGR